jgi:hypothetical protein
MALFVLLIVIGGSLMLYYKDGRSSIVAVHTDAVKSAPAYEEQYPPTEFIKIALGKIEPEKIQDANSQKVPASWQTVSAPTRVYYVQLATVRSEEAAQREASWLRVKLQRVLGNREVNIHKIEKTGKRIMYGVNTGPLASSDEANQLCNTLQRHAKKCVVASDDTTRRH